MNKEVCPGCPFLASLEVAKETCKKTPEFYKGDNLQKIALGSIIHDQQILEGIVERIGCGGPKNAEGAYLVCPHTRSIGDAQNHMIGPLSQQVRNEYDLTTFLDDKDDKSKSSTNSGQYL